MNYPVIFTKQDIITDPKDKRLPKNYEWSEMCLEVKIKDEKFFLPYGNNGSILTVTAPNIPESKLIKLRDLIAEELALQIPRRVNTIVTKTTYASKKLISKLFEIINSKRDEPIELIKLQRGITPESINQTEINREYNRMNKPGKKYIGITENNIKMIRQKTNCDLSKIVFVDNRFRSGQTRKAVESIVKEVCGYKDNNKSLQSHVALYEVPEKRKVSTPSWLKPLFVTPVLTKSN